MGDSYQTTCAGTSESLATVNEAVVTATAASSTPSSNSTNTENTDYNIALKIQGYVRFTP